MYQKHQFLSFTFLVVFSFLICMSLVACNGELVKHGYKTVKTTDALYIMAHETCKALNAQDVLVGAKAESAVKVLGTAKITRDACAAALLSYDSALKTYNKAVLENSIAEESTLAKLETAEAVLKSAVSDLVKNKKLLENLIAELTELASGG